MPASTPPEVVRRLSAEITKAVSDPDLQRELLNQGFVAKASSPEQMTQRMQADIKKWGDVIAKAHIPRH